MNNMTLAKTLVKSSKNPCWKGYEPVGMKMKNGRKVPNCVPKKGLKKSCGCNSCDTLAKTVIGREKKPTPDAKKGKHVCGQCNGKGLTPKCEGCGYESTPYGTMRATKPSQWKKRSFTKSSDLLVSALLKKEKPFHGYNPNKHSRKGGLNAKGRAKAKREEGANLKPPVTTKPSKLKAGSKKAKRRKSFCARMGGVKGPTSKGGKLTPKGAALKRWNC